jgi:uncharacterized protein (TIGR02145 family)
MKAILSYSVTILLIFLLFSCKKEEIPVLTTSAISNITGTTAVSGGVITDEGSSTVITRGVCWSTDTKPTIADNKTSDGAGAGTFTSTITGLNGATTYYVRSYATNSAGTGYGMAMSFTTKGETPLSDNSAATNITTVGATLNGAVNPNFLSTEVTFEYGETTIYGNTIAALQSPVTGNTLVTVSADIDGLTPGTIYHFRVKSVNSLGTTYSDDLTFTTLGQRPTVISLPATFIYTTNAVFNGSVNPNFLSTVVTFEYGTTTDYGSSIAANQNVISGNADNSVNVSVSGLSAGMVYHYRVKAQNQLGIVYGEDETFTTLGQAPLAATQLATNIYTTASTLNAIVNANYLSTVITFEYGTTTNYGSSVTAVQSPLTSGSTTSVSADISGLAIGTEYHYRVKAENQLGITYGSDVTFTTVGTSVTDVDGNVYSIIQIGTQFWTGENLKTTKFNDNTDIPLVTDANTWINLATPAFCWYNNDEATNKDVYGGLYNFYAVSSGKLCPAGWHVPSNDEFTILSNYLGGVSVAGGKMKETGTIHWSSPNTGATNESNFTGLPGGQRNEAGDFAGMGLNGIWWSSTPYNNIKPWYRSLGSTISALFVGNGSLNIRGFSIRCIKD